MFYATRRIWGYYLNWRSWSHDQRWTQQSEILGLLRWRHKVQLQYLQMWHEGRSLVRNRHILLLHSVLWWANKVKVKALATWIMTTTGRKKSLKIKEILLKALVRWRLRHMTHAFIMWQKVTDLPMLAENHPIVMHLKKKLPLRAMN